MRSLQATANGISSGGWIPASATCPSATNSSRDPSRNCKRGVWRRRSYRGRVSTRHAYHVSKQVSVIGSGAEWEAAAEEIGRLLAERGCTVVTGGLGEVMAAAHRGAKAAGGTTIAILPGERREDANPWADHVVVTGIGQARTLAVAASGDAVIAVGGAWGTLAEIAFARRLGRRVVALAGAPEVNGIETAATPAEAVELALRDLE